MKRDSDSLTKSDLDKVVEKLMAAIAGVEARLENRMDASDARLEEKIDAKFEDLKRYIDVVIENRQLDLGGAKFDAVEALKDEQKRTDHRIIRLEREVEKLAA